MQQCAYVLPCRSGCDCDRFTRCPTPARYEVVEPDGATYPMCTDCAAGMRADPLPPGDLFRSFERVVGSLRQTT